MPERISAHAMQAFIESDVESAAIRIRNSFNPFGGFLTNATYTLKSTCAAVPEARLEALFRETGNGPLEGEREHTVDLYLMPPGEDQETCRDWIRMRLRDGRYSLLFEEYVSDGDLLISPSTSYEVHVRVLSGLMSLGYSIGAIIKRSSVVFKGARFTCKADEITQLDKRFFQIEGRDRHVVEAAGAFLGLGGTYCPRSYIEQVPGRPPAHFPSDPSASCRRRTRIPFVTSFCARASARARARARVRIRIRIRGRIRIRVRVRSVTSGPARAPSAGVRSVPRGVPRSGAFSACSTPCSTCCSIGYCVELFDSHRRSDSDARAAAPRLRRAASARRRRLRRRSPGGAQGARASTWARRASRSAAGARAARHCIPAASAAAAFTAAARASVSGRRDVKLRN